MSQDIRIPLSKSYWPHIGTFVYVILVLFILLWFKISKPIEVEEGEGLLVDFGYTEQGIGESEPDKNNPMTQVAIPSPGNPPFTQEVKEKVLVQEEELTEKMDIPNQPEDKKVVVVENLLKNPAKAEKLSKNPAETSESKEAKQVNENAMFKGFKGTGSGNGSQGNTEGQGNMGDPSGSKSDNYLGKSTGLGSEGEGRGMIGKGLIGRKLSSIPPITDNSNKTGKIVIKVSVSSDGKVISAVYTPQGTTITDSDLINKCEAVAKKAKFSPSEDKDTDQGTLIFSFDVR